jgi:hypothetical protein
VPLRRGSRVPAHPVLPRDVLHHLRTC